MNQTDFKLKFFSSSLNRKLFASEKCYQVWDGTHWRHDDISRLLFQHPCGLLWQVPTNDMETKYIILAGFYSLEFCFRGFDKRKVDINDMTSIFWLLCHHSATALQRSILSPWVNLQYALSSIFQFIMYDYDVTCKRILAGRAKVMGVSQISEPYVGSFRQSLLWQVPKCDGFLFFHFCQYKRMLTRRAKVYLSYQSPMSAPLAAAAASQWYAMAHITKDNLWSGDLLVNIQ